MPNATHLTFAALASTYPDIKLGGTRVLTAPYGLLDNGYYAVGSLELLSDQPPLPILDETKAKQLGGQKNEVVDFHQAFPHSEWHIVIQNPPFTKPNADANASDNKGLFRGHDRPEDDAEAMRLAVASKDRRVSKGAGMAGLGAYFVDLADKKLKRGGVPWALYSRQLSLLEPVCRKCEMYGQPNTVMSPSLPSPKPMR